MTTIATTGLMFLGGCAAPPPSVHAKPEADVTSGSIRMPAGVDLGRLRLVDEARLTKVYVQMVGIGDASDDNLLFPPEVAKSIGITNRQMGRRFMDMISAGRRFEVYDDTTTVTREQSDIVIDGMITAATQDVQDLRVVRKPLTTVRMSVQMKDVTTGQLLFPAPVAISGIYGSAQGEGTLLEPSASLQDPSLQRSLANDYERALEKGFAAAAHRIWDVLRPLGRVLAVDAEQIDIVGGSRHGFQGGDELVVFSATMTQLGGRDVIQRTQAIAVVRCDGVGTETSQCDIIRRDPRYAPQVGNYVVLSDVSASSVRVE
jgi:hypothetical protein